MVPRSARTGRACSSCASSSRRVPDPSASWEATDRASRGTSAGQAAQPRRSPSRPPATRPRCVGAICAVLDWLALMPGDSWQQRWLASAARRQARRLAGCWRLRRPRPAAPSTAVRSARHRVRRGLTVLICADVIRPSLRWLLATATTEEPGRRAGPQPRPGGFRRVERRSCRADRPRATRPGRSRWRRIAVIMAAKGGHVGDITVGDCLELLRPPRGHQATGRQRITQPVLLPAAARRWASSPTTRPATRAFARLRPAEHRGDDRPLRYRVPTDPRPARGLPAGTPGRRRTTTPLLQLSYGSPGCSGEIWSCTTRASTRCACPPMSPPPGSSGSRSRRPRPSTNGESSSVTHRGYRRSSTMGNVRSFYLDIAQWATEDPSRWGPWVAPCPIRDGELTAAASKTAAAANRGWTSAPASVCRCCPP